MGRCSRCDSDLPLVPLQVLAAADGGSASSAACMAALQGLLDTPGGEERVVLKRVKARVQVRVQQAALVS